MKRLLLMRVVAQLIDIIVSMALLVGTFLVLVPGILSLWNNPAVAGVTALILAAVLMVLIQYPFLKVGQTVGKALCGLEIVATDNQPLTVNRLLRRELLLKFATLYIICFPAFSGQPGGHEEATATKVIRKSRAQK